MKRIVAAIGLVLPVALAVACRTYGDEDERVLPDQSDGSATIDGTTTSASSSGTPAPDIDGGGGDGSADAGPPFCERDENLNTIRCIDFEKTKETPFGFDSYFGATDGLVPSPFPNSGDALTVITKPLPGAGFINTLPQNAASITVEFDLVVNATADFALPQVAVFAGNGNNCNTSLGLAGDKAGDAVRFKVVSGGTSTLFAAPSPIGAPLHVLVRSTPAPAAGKTVDLLVRVTAAGVTDTVGSSGPIPAACTSFTAALGMGPGLGDPKVTFDNIVVR